MPSARSVIHAAFSSAMSPVVRFEWDPDKARQNVLKHGVPFDDAATAFSDPLSITIFDPDHSFKKEDRFVLIGATSSRRLVLVVHTDRDQAIRIISARLAAKKERKT